MIYCHPGTSVTEFTKQFSDFLSNITLRNKDICIFWDANINLLKKDKVQSIKNYNDEICSFGLTNVINVPTRVSKLGGTLIDHFYYSNPQKILDSNVLLSDISDHNLLYAKLKYCNLSKTNINSKV